VLTFSSWEADIASVTELPEYQNATIQITDPSALTTTYSYETNAYTVTGDGLVYEGQARIQPNRSAREIDYAPVQDPSSAKAILIQIPSAEVVTIRRGFQVRVTDGGRNVGLENLLFTVVADVNSSHMASHTFEAVANVEVDPQWTNPAPPGD